MHTHTHISCSGGCRGDPACTLTQNNVGAREKHVCARRLSEFSLCAQFVISQIM